MKLFALTGLLCFLLLTTSSGCIFTNWRLRQSVVHQGKTLTELQYQQVLNNIAMLSRDPDALPSHVNLRDGSAQIQDNGSILSPSNLPTVGASRTVVEQWSLLPVADDTTLRVLQVAYRRALGFQEVPDLDLANDLAHDLCKQISNSDYIDIRSDPNVNVAALNMAKVLGGLTDVEAQSYSKIKEYLEAREKRPDYYFKSADVFEPALSRLNVLANAFRQLTIDSNDEVLVYEGDIKYWSRLRLVPRGSGTAVPASGKSLVVVVTDESNLLHIRIFDDAGNCVTDTDETKLPADKAEAIAALKKTLSDLSNPDKLTDDEEADVITQAASIVGQTLRRGRVSGMDITTYVIRYDGTLYPLTASPVVRDARRQIKQLYSDMNELHSGWFGVGPWKAVPHDACYVGHYRGQYAWVRLEGRQELAKFTLKVLSFATMVKDPSITSVPGGPRFSPSVPTR
jgi:hypothetical protein